MSMETSRIDRKLEEVNRKLSEVLSSENKIMGEILKWISSQKGKQLRPKFVIASSGFGSKSDYVCDAAAIIEIIHMASLIQDDIVDKSDFRRGVESVHSKFGIPMAMYAVDYMLFSAFSEEMMWENRNFMAFAAKSSKKILSGELEQYLSLYNLDITVEKYLENISGKTGELFSIACRAGASVAQADEQVVEELSKFGLYYGILFQIKDDFLDLFSKKKIIGKPVLQDFANGIYTLAMIFALKIPHVYEFAAGLREKTKRGEMLTDSEKKSLIKFAFEFGIDGSFEIINEYYKKASDALINLADCEEKKFFQDVLEKEYRSIAELVGKM